MMRKVSEILKKLDKICTSVDCADKETLCREVKSGLVVLVRELIAWRGFYRIASLSLLSMLGAFTVSLILGLPLQVIATATNTAGIVTAVLMFVKTLRELKSLRV